MKSKLILAGLLLFVVMPAAQAAVISIDDIGEALTLFVALPNQITQPPSPAPGSGNPIDITTPTPSDGISSIVYDPATEFLSFIFADQVNWNSNVLFYRYFTETSDAGNNPSDLFIIQGQVGTAPDHIAFSSAETLTGNIATDMANLNVTALFAPLSQAVNLGTVDEVPAWQLAFDTGVDQYYIRSVPEPASLALLGLGLAGLAASRRRKQ